MLDRTVPPQPHDIGEVSILQAEKKLLDSGLPVYYINTGGQEVVKLELVANAGSKFDQKSGSSFFASKMLTEGTSGSSSTDLAQLFDFYGAQIDISPGFDYSSLTVYILRKNLSAILPILKEILVDSSFDKDELEIQKRLKRDSLTVNLEKNQFQASRKIRETIFGENHPYGRSLNLEDIEEISREDVVTFFNHHFFNNPTMVLSGMILPTDLELIEQHLGKLKFKNQTFDITPLRYKAQKEVLLEKEESLQSSIRLGKTALSKSHPDYIKCLVVNEILGGYFGSRLMKNIREDKGFTYGISSNIMNLNDGALQVIGTDVKKEFRQQTIDEIFKEIKLLCTERVPENELETVKNYMQGSFLSSINTPFALADKFKAIHFHGLDYSFYQDYLSTIKTITSQEILETAQTHFRAEDYSVVVVG